MIDLLLYLRYETNRSVYAREMETLTVFGKWTAKELNHSTTPPLETRPLDNTSPYHFCLTKPLLGITYTLQYFCSTNIVQHKGIGLIYLNDKRSHQILDLFRHNTVWYLLLSNLYYSSIFFLKSICYF